MWAPWPIRCALAGHLTSALVLPRRTYVSSTYISICRSVAVRVQVIAQSLRGAMKSVQAVDGTIDFRIDVVVQCHHCTFYTHTSHARNNKEMYRREAEFSIDAVVVRFPGLGSLRPKTF
jgi:hypothetical protein